MNIIVTHAIPEERIEDSRCVFLQTGIGKLNAYSSLFRRIKDSKLVNVIISIGYCGGMNGVSIGDIIIAESIEQKFSIGKLDGLIDEYLLPPKTIFCNYHKQIKDLELNGNVKYGKLITMDEFYSGQAIRDFIGVDMETYAIALYCMDHSIPFISIRQVSDVVVEVDNHIQFNQSLNSYNIKEILDKVIEKVLQTGVIL